MSDKKELIQIKINFVHLYKDRQLYHCKPNITQNKGKMYWINSVNIS